MHMRPDDQVWITLVAHVVLLHCVCRQEVSGVGKGPAPPAHRDMMGDVQRNTIKHPDEIRPAIIAGCAIRDVMVKVCGERLFQFAILAHMGISPADHHHVIYPFVKRSKRVRSDTQDLMFHIGNVLITAVFGIEVNNIAVQYQKPFCAFRVLPDFLAHFHEITIDFARIGRRFCFPAAAHSNNVRR